MIQDFDNSFYSHPHYRRMVSHLSVDGVPDLASARSRPWKLVWTTVLVAAGIMLVVQIGFTINTYVTSPLSSSWSVASLKEKNFPMLYICPVHVSESTWFLSPNVFAEIDEYLNSIFSNHEFGFNPSVITSHDATRNSTDFVKACYFERKSLNCSDVVKEVYDPKYGKCIVVDVKNPQQKTGFGLTLVLKTGKKSVPGTIRGAVLSIMDSYNSIGGMTNALLQTGHWSKIVLQAQHYNMLSTDGWSNKRLCYENDTASPSSEIYQSLNSSTYSWDLCRLDCTQTLVKKYCNHTLLLDPAHYPTSSETCNTGYLSFCVFNAINEHKKELEECKEKCLMPCSFWQYDLTLSSVKLNDRNNMVDENDSQMCDIKVAKGDLCLPSTIILDIGYLNLFYTDVSQSIAMTWDTFIGNIGGQVGLWMGMSVISVFQVLILALTAVQYKSNKVKSQYHQKYRVSVDDSGKHIAKF